MLNFSRFLRFSLKQIPRREDSGLLKGIALLEGIKGIATIRFTNEDIVRHPLVNKIVKAFDKKESDG